MQMSALCSASSISRCRLGLNSPLLAIRPGTAPARTRLSFCRAQTQDYAPQSETQLHGANEPTVFKAIKAACLLPAVMCLLWAGPAHAKKSRQPAAAAQIMEVQTAETHSPVQELQAKWQALLLQLQTGSLQQQVTAELQKPDVQKGLAAVAGLLLLAMIWKGSSSSSSSTTTSSSSSGSGGSSTSSSAAAAPAASLAAAASSNGTSAAPRAASTKQPVPAAAAAASSAAMSDAVSAQEILQVVKEAADKVSATAAATASEVSASAAAAAAAVERAQAVTDKAHSSLSRSTSPDVPEPPKLVKPSLTAAAAAPAVNQAAAAAAESNSNGNGAEPRRRSPPPSPIPILPERGAATPALAVLGAGALLLDLMAPLGKLAVASVSRGVSRSSSPVSNAGGDSSNGTSSSAPGGSRSAARAAPAAAAAPATPAVQEVRKPATQSKLAKAVERATAEAAAAVPRTVPTELPPVTLKELEEALKAGQKV